MESFSALRRFRAWLRLQANNPLSNQPRNFRSQSSGGSDAEFLAGPSVSFFRTMFLTPGLHIGHKVSLGGGFHEGDIVPASITQVPLDKSYKLGFGLAITFTKP